MSKHKRREGYWPYYERANKGDEDHVAETLLRLIRENPHPPRGESGRGRPPVHSKEKLDFACLYGMANNYTFRETEKKIRYVRHIWDEPIPDHSWLSRHMQTIDEDWLDRILNETVKLCMAELGDATAPVGADSSGVETDRYETVERQNPEMEDLVKKDRKIYWKYHITAILGHQIILAASTTQSSISDTEMLPVMLEKIRQSGLDLSGRTFNADRGYDSDSNCAAIFEMDMIPNIKQRDFGQDARSNHGKPSRKRAAELYDPEEYKQRGMIEGIFGAEEARDHSLHCRFIREDNRRRFGKGRAIAWNIRVLGRFKCANELDTPIPSYGKAVAA